MIRASMLDVARMCGLAVQLSEDYPSTSAAAMSGVEHHSQVERFFKMECTEDDLDAPAKFMVDAIRTYVPKGELFFHVEKEFPLIDPESLELLTVGHPDVVVFDDKTKTVYVFDLKTGNPENVRPVEDNLQLQAYGVAASMSLNATTFHAFIVYSQVGAIEASGPIHETAFMPIIGKIADAASTSPIANMGSHCTNCYVRKHCPQWNLPVLSDKMSDVVKPFTVSGELTTDNAAQGLLFVQAIEEAAELMRENLKAFVRQNGPIIHDGKAWGPSQRSGRKYIDKAAMAEAGLNPADYERVGRPFEEWRWKKV